MNTPSPEPALNVCPKCGKPILEGSPRGLCPLCLISEVARDDSPSVSVPGPELDELRRAFPSLEIVEPLGAGGMGRVYKVRQPHLDRFCALKLLPAGWTDDPAWVERFTREARALARLNHPGIVHVYDFGEATTTLPDGGKKAFPFLLMEYVDGVNLRQALRSGSLSAAEALAIVPPICAALQYAHNQGVLHRDIKPENILLDLDGLVKIADFGLAKLAANPAVPGATLTATGAQLGTAAYMAPEQIERPQDVDHRADIYSLGVVFYELLTGELPLGRFPAPSETAGTDPRLDTIVFRTLEKQRERRFQSAGAVKTEVEHVTSSEPPPMPSAPMNSASPAVEPSARKASRKTVAGILACIVSPIALLALMLLMPLAARTDGSGRSVALVVGGAVLLIAALTVACFTWLFGRLQRAGLSTGLAAALVALGLIVAPPLGCVVLLVPAYWTHRPHRPFSPSDQVELVRDATNSRKNEVTAHWKVISQRPLWITVEAIGARRNLQLQPDGRGRFTAEIDARIVRSFAGESGTLQLDLGNGKGKAGGEFSFLAPPDGWLDRVFDDVAIDGPQSAGVITLARIGSDPMTLVVSPEPPETSADAVNFTLRSVSAYETDKQSMLVIEYLEKFEGDAELYFKTDGMDGSPIPSSTIGRIAGLSELRGKLFWHLPEGLNDAIRRDLKFRIESQYLDKPIRVPVGESWEFFQLKLPDGTMARVTLGARDGKR